MQGWAERFLADLTASTRTGRVSARSRRPAGRRDWMADLRRPGRRRRACRARPLLVGLDVDGVLAPIVAHADDAELLPGVLEAVGALADRTPVAIVSGRTVEDLAPIRVPGRRADVRAARAGAARRAGASSWVAHERRRLDRLAALADPPPPSRAGDGAWVELKPAGVVLHVREAHPEIGARSARRCWLSRAADVDRRSRQAGPRRGRAARPPDEQGRGDGRAAAGSSERRHRVRRRRPHRRRGVHRHRRRRLLDPCRPRRHRRPLPPGRPPRGAALPGAR